MAHYLRSKREEVGPALIVHILLIDQAQVSFMNQGRRLQHVIATFTSHVIRREAAQFFIDQRKQPVERSLVPTIPVRKQTSDLSWTRHSEKPWIYSKFAPLEACEA